jgi:hypothetical protein
MILHCFSRGHHLDCRGAGTGAEHWAAMVLPFVGIVDAVVDRSVYRLECDLLRHAGGNDSSRLLPHDGPTATGILPIVVTHVQGVVEQKNEPVQREDNLVNLGQTSLRIRELDPFNT